MYIFVNIVRQCLYPGGHRRSNKLKKQTQFRQREFLNFGVGGMRRNLQIMFLCWPLHRRCENTIMHRTGEQQKRPTCRVMILYD